MRANVKLAVILLLTGLLLVACGKKGPVRPVQGPLPLNSVTADQQPAPDCCN